MTDWLKVNGLCGGTAMGKTILFDKIKGLRPK
jgi:hypothetical protein